MDKNELQDNLSMDSVKKIIQDLNKNDKANKTSVGFIYQDLVFIKQLLFLENNGTEIGYEVLDDLHIIKENNLDLIQVKSSINNDILTESSLDFWKTLFNWAKLIKKDIPNNIKFLFYTNRTLSNKSDIFNELIKEKPDIERVINSINILYEKVNEKEKIKEKDDSKNPIFEKLKSFNNLSKDQKEKFLINFKFIISEDNIVNEIKQRISFFGIDNTREIDIVYESLLGIITDKRLELASNNKEFVVDYNYFRKNLKFDRILKLSRIEEVNFDEYYNYRDKNKYNEDFENEIFYKQLVDIGIPVHKVHDLARERANASSFIGELELLPSEENIINSKLIEEWEEVHEQEYKKTIIDEKDHLEKAQNCLNNTKVKNIYYKNSNLPKPLTKGKFIDLSNEPRLGWRFDWKEKYSE